jgi:aconitase A
MKVCVHVVVIVVSTLCIEYTLDPTLITRATIVSCTYSSNRTRIIATNTVYRTLNQEISQQFACNIDRTHYSACNGMLLY